MGRYLVKRLIMTLASIFLVILFLSVLVDIIPGKPAQIMLGPRANKALVQQVQKEMHLNEPVYEQVWDFFSGAAQGDLGVDFLSHKPVSDLVIEALPYTLTLVVAALLLAALAGIPFGVYAATRPGTLVDRLTAVISISFITSPYYVSGLYLLLIFALHFQILPAVGAGDFSKPGGYVQHLVLPACALAITWVGYIARLVRTSMLEILNANYIRTSRAFGLKQRTINYKYALKNALIPTVAVLALAVGELMSGAVFVEVIFSRQGIGRLIVRAIENHNFPIVRAGILIIALIYIFSNLIADLCYRFLDPRIRLEEQ